MSAVMLKKNAVSDLQQLRGKKACFPVFDGYGKIKYYSNLKILVGYIFCKVLFQILVWNSFLLALKLENIVRYPNNETVKHFFKESCAILSSDKNVIMECDFDGKV